MERDHFKDRPETVQYNSKIYKDSVVFICLKNMQKTAREISDLTLTRVTANLTTQWKHPRGQKIKGDFIETDRYGNKIYKDGYKEVVGRCTYIMDENLWSFDTTEGKKFLFYNRERDKLQIIPYGSLKGSLKLYAIFKHKRASFKIPLCKYVFLKSIEEAQDFIDTLSITACEYKEDKIFFTINGAAAYEDDFEMFLDENKIINPREMYYYVDSVSNGCLELEVENFTIEKII